MRDEELGVDYGVWEACGLEELVMEVAEPLDVVLPLVWATPLEPFGVLGSTECMMATSYRGRTPAV